jgi:hypothetical protein
MISLIFATLISCKTMEDKNSSITNNPETIDGNTFLQEGTIYQTKVYCDEYGNWNISEHPRILMNHALGFHWQNTDAFSELKNAENGDKKAFIFKVIKIEIEYRPHYEDGVKTNDLWIDTAICQIIEIK